MIQLFCIREDAEGRPEAGKLMWRKFRTPSVAAYWASKFRAKGWTRVVHLDADDYLAKQFAHWSSSLLGVNPRYVLNPAVLISYVRGPNWNEPDVKYAHYEQRIKGYGEALWHEFASYRSLPDDEAVRRMTALLEKTGLRYKEAV